MMDRCKSSCLLIFLLLTVFLSACDEAETLIRKTETTPVYLTNISPTASTQKPAPTHTVIPTPTVTPKVTATATPIPSSPLIPGGPFTTLPPGNPIPGGPFTTLSPGSPLPSGPFTTLSPGSPLPSDAACAARVQRSSWEPRPNNATANNTNVYAQGHRLTGSYLAQYGYEGRVTGNFTGTTDEILQWGACKWGIDENVVRAQAVQEGYWRQSTLGGCGVKSQPETHSCDTVGILQVRGAGLPSIYPGTWPYAYDSTAFNVDYTLAIWRTCFEGKETWLGNRYQAGDLWGCVGRWFSGDWSQSSQGYIASVKNIMANKDWLKPGF